MATVSFSAPDEVKRKFQETFRGVNKSSIIAELMRRAVEERRRRQRRATAIEALLELRQELPPVEDWPIARARRTGRS